MASKRTAYAKDARVDTYVKSLPAWQQDVAARVRDTVHAADAAVQETIKRTTLPYFVLEGNICALVGTKDHLNILIYDPIAPDPHGIINQGHDNATARAIQVYENDHLDRGALLQLFRAVIANNRAGGWRKVSELSPRQPAPGTPSR
ncbi:MAG: DUF1801 domain-containing protein [Candidatus Dormibacteria bacterium]